MQKRFAVLLMCLFLAALLPIGVFAEEEEYQVFINGMPYEFLEPDGGDYMNRRLIQYVPLAQYAGFETSFHAETGRVTSVKGEKTISFVLGEESAVVTENGAEETFTFYPNIRSLNGSTYIPPRAVENLFGFIVKDSYNGYDDKKVYISDPSLFVQEFKAKTSNFVRYLEQAGIPDDFTLSMKGSTEIAAESETFGIRLDSMTGAEAVLEKLGDRLRGDITIDNSGLMNFLDLYFKGAFRGIQPDKQSFDIDKPVKWEFVYDGENLYQKGDEAVAETIYSSSYGLSVEQREELIRSAQGKWIKSDTQKDAWKKEMPYGKYVKDGKLDIDKFITLMLKNLLSNQQYSWRSADGKEYADFMAALLSDRYITLTETEYGTGMRYTLDQTSLRNEVLNAELFEDDEARQYFEDFCGGLTFKLDLAIMPDKEGKLQSDLAFDLFIANFPNELDIDIGNVSCTVNFTAEQVPSSAGIQVPADYVDYQKQIDEMKATEEN